MLDTTRHIIHDLTFIGITRQELSVRARKNRVGENIAWDIRLLVSYSDRARRNEIAELLRKNQGYLADAWIATHIIWTDGDAIILFTFGKRGPHTEQTLTD